MRSRHEPLVQVSERREFVGHASPAAVNAAGERALVYEVMTLSTRSWTRVAGADRRRRCAADDSCNGGPRR